jgi:TolA-binding protein
MNKIIIFSIISFIYISSQSFSQTASERYSAAMSAYNSLQYGKAHHLFEEFFNQYDLYDELYSTAKFYSANSLLNLGEFDAAAAGFEFLVNNFEWSSFREEALYKLGMLYFDTGEYSKSRVRFQKLLKEYPETEHTGSALYWIGESYTAENRNEDAIEFLEEAVTKRSNNKYIDYSIFTLASAYEKTGDYENAVKYYDQLLSYHKNSPLAVSAQIRIGICYFKLKDYQSSILELNSPMLNNLPPELFAESLYLLANSYYRVEDYKNAEETYLEIIRNFPSSELIRDAKYGLAWAYFQQTNYNDAFKVFNSLSEETDGIAEKSFFWKAESKRYSGKETEAFNIYKEFSKKFPDSELGKGVQYQMGVLYFNNNQLKEAEEFIKKSLSSSDNIVRTRAYTLLGEIQLDKKQFTSAKQSFEAALSINSIPEDLKNRSLLGSGVALFYLKQYQDAITNFLSVETNNSLFEKNKVNYYLAESFYASGKYSEALKRYGYVDISDNDMGAQSLYGKAYCYFNLTDYENAAYAYNDFIKRFPEDSRSVDAHLRLADSYYGSKNYSSASKIYKKLFNVGTGEINNPYTYYQYAQALYKAGNIQEALKEFKTLQEKFPESNYADEALYTVGWISFQQGNFDNAIAQYKNVMQVYPASSLNPIIYYSIGDAYFNNGKYDSAMVNYQKVISEYPSSNYVFDAVNGIQYCYVAKNQPEKAINLIDQFVINNPGLSFSDQIFYKKGEIYYSMREYEKAKTGYKEFISNYPKSKFVPDAYYWVGKCAQNLNQNEEAIYNFTQVFETYPTSEAAAASVIEVGNIHNNLKDYDAALTLYDKAIGKLSKSPKLPEILFNKGMTLINKNDLSTAYEALLGLAQDYKGSIFAEKAKFEMGLLELAAGNFENADFYFKNLSETRSDDLGAKAQYYYGLSLSEQEKFNEAIDAFERVRLVFSAYDEWLTKSYLKLGECYTKIEEFDKAKEMYRAVLTKHRGNEFGQEAQDKLRELQ